MHAYFTVFMSLIDIAAIILYAAYIVTLVMKVIISSYIATCIYTHTTVVALVTPNFLKDLCCLLCSIGYVPCAIKHRDRGFHNYSGRDSGLN